MDMDDKGVVHSKDDEWILLYDAQFVQGFTDFGGVLFISGENDDQHILDVCLTKAINGSKKFTIFFRGP